jgi:hypothetical protein
VSQSDWHNMTDDARRALFDAYQNDHTAITRRTSQPTSAISSAIQSGRGYDHVVQNFSDAHQTIRGFNAAAEPLRVIRSFHHRPSYHYDEWEER